MRALNTSSSTPIRERSAHDRDWRSLGRITYLEPTMPQTVNDRLRTRSHAQFSEDMAHVRVHGPYTEPELACNLLGQTSAPTRQPDHPGTRSLCPGWHIVRYAPREHR